MKTAGKMWVMVCSVIFSLISDDYSVVDLMRRLSLSLMTNCAAHANYLVDSSQVIRTDCIFAVAYNNVISIKTIPIMVID